MAPTTDGASMQVPSLITTALVVVSVIFPLLSLLAIFFRFKARGLARLPLQADDWWIVVSWVLAFGLSINIWVFGGLAGINTYRIDPLVGTSDSLMCLTVASVLVDIPLATVKISILLFYKRIFNTRGFKTIVWILIPLVTAWGIIFAVLMLLQGDPIDALWTGVGRLRFNSTALGLASVGTSMVLDLIVLCLPLPIIFGLHLNMQKKVSIAAIFWLGSFCCVAAAVRVALINASVRAVIASQSSGFSAIYLQSTQFVFVILEPQCSIIAGCLPCYGPLFAGGRAPESLIRSVRSVFSLASRGSTDNSTTHRSGKADVTVEGRSSSESHIELRNTTSDWLPPQQGIQTSVNANSKDHFREAPIESYGINVTKAVDVTRA